jgi:hypothetical protein
MNRFSDDVAYLVPCACRTFHRRLEPAHEAISWTVRLFDACCLLGGLILLSAHSYGSLLSRSTRCLNYLFDRSQLPQPQSSETTHIATHRRTVHSTVLLSAVAGIVIQFRSLFDHKRRRRTTADSTCVAASDRERFVNHDRRAISYAMHGSGAVINKLQACWYMRPPNL